jgi:hypothetical protein
VEKGFLKTGWVIVFLVMTSWGFGGSQDWDFKAILVPDNPTIYDSINITSSGIAGSGGVIVEDTSFQIIGTDLTYEIFLKVGPLTVITPWSYTEDVGILPVGTYDLTVTAYYDYGGFTASEEYFTSFEVVIPEPASIFLLGAGLIFCRRKKK